MMTFGSLFAGIGGFDLGLERAGMQCVWQVEIDDYATRVLEKHWPNVRRFRDVRECGANNLTAVDLICGGFPCQPHSLAGKRQGAADDRDLWPEYRRIVGELQPAWVIGENVPGIRTTILDQVLSDLEGLDYSARTLVVPACAFDAPHIRERVFVIAHANSVGYSRQAAWQSAPDEKRNDKAYQSGREAEFFAPVSSGEDVANTRSAGLEKWEAQPPASVRPIDRTGLAGRGKTRNWAAEPNVGRVAHGVPNRVDRLRCLGNAVVPQVVEWIGRRIVEVHDADL